MSTDLKNKIKSYDTGEKKSWLKEQDGKEVKHEQDGQPTFIKNPADVKISHDIAAVELLSQNIPREALEFIEKQIKIDRSTTSILSTSTIFNIQNIKPSVNGVVYPSNIINLKNINTIALINEFFSAVNNKLPEGGKFIGCFESKNQRKKRILQKYPPLLNWIYYFFDFIFKRVFPKLNITRKIYFFITAGRNRVLTQVETFGRLYYAGFKLVDYQTIGNKVYFVAQKMKEPCSDPHPSYGFLCKLNRNGKDGKPIYVYKLRTMHAYSEYLQEYIYEKNKLQDGGKFHNDFRISFLGKFFRVYWLDEIPMFINFFKGDLKLVGVRPLSTQYLNLYSEELKQMRAKWKPGLIPPYYADLPKTLEEIMESEMKYLTAYEKNPWLTDFKYLLRITMNILFKRAKSK